MRDVRGPLDQAVLISESRASFSFGRSATAAKPTQGGILQKLIWHYTADRNFQSIIKDGFIRPATTYIAPGEKPVVWFSREQFWEPTTFLNWGMTGAIRRGFRLLRIGMNTADAPHRWSELRELSGMSPEIAGALARSAREVGANPSRWYGTFEPVPIHKWKAIEYFNLESWAPLFPGAGVSDLGVRVRSLLLPSPRPGRATIGELHIDSVPRLAND
jgi:hypothetical protein